MLTPWPHQQHGFDEVLSLQAGGEHRILLVSPTGGGKTLIAAMLLRHWLAEGLTCAVYTNRKILIDQLSRVLDSFGLDHGIRAAGRAADHKNPLQLISIQTEAGRAGLKRRRCRGCGTRLEADRYVCSCGTVADFTPVNLAQRNIIDEAHLNATPQMQAIMELGEETHGSYYLGITATPLDMGHVYRKMVVAGTTSELRKCGALVPAIHYGPDEPDLRDLGRLDPGEDLTEKQASSAIMRDGIFGRVLEWFERLNPGHRPSILFAPGVKESLWFAEQLSYPHLREERWQNLPAIPAAHIDGEEVWWGGKFQRTSQEARDEVLAKSKSGDIVVLCNRFVLREGIDAPWLSHGVFATIFGSLQSYLQSGGRLLRAHPGLEHVTIQDHGGNYHRHGSLNADREWDLAYTAPIAAGLRADRLRSKRCRHCHRRCTEPKCEHCGASNEVEQERCPECARIIFGKRCPCGFVLPAHRSRVVVQSDGDLKEVSGDIYKPLRVCKAPGAKERWVKVYWRSKNSKNHMTFKQAFALFARENHWGWPDLSWPYMPRHELDHFMPVASVPYERLIPNPDMRVRREEASVRQRGGPGEDPQGDGLFGAAGGPDD